MGKQEYNHQYYEKNKEKHREKVRLYYQQNREKHYENEFSKNVLKTF